MTAILTLQKDRQREKKPYMFTIHYVSNETYLRKGQARNVTPGKINQTLSIPRMPTAELYGPAALFYNQ